MAESSKLSDKDAKGLQKGRTRRFSATVLIVILLFSFIYSTVVFIVVYPWLEWSVYGVFNIALFTFLTGTAFVMYICCIVRDPGRIPAGWVPDTESASVLEVKKDGEVRYCQKCTQYKPARTHHCRVCDRCVLRMDHHCVWINNCVGHNNYRSFLLFLIYVTCAVFHGLVLLLAHTFQGMNGGVVRYVRKGTPEGVSSTLAPLAETVAIIIAFPLVIALGLLLGWHIYLVAHNKTTIEYHEGVRSRTKGGQRVGKHIYDLGMFENPHSILGGGCWLLPGCAAEGDGLNFPTAVDAQRPGR